MPTLFALLALLLVGCGSPPSNAIEGKIRDEIERGISSGRGHVDHSSFSALLRDFVDDQGLVDYDRLRDERGRLDSYLEVVAKASIGDLPQGELLALFLNAYNAHTLRAIVDAPPDLASIRDLDNPWGRAERDVGGFLLSLDDIEHRILRPLLVDARVHFAVNCASIGCPPLAPEAFAADQVEQQLDQNTRTTLRHKAHLRVDGNTIFVTKLLDWYRDDFDRRPGGIPRFLVDFGPKEVDEAYKANSVVTIDYLDYDWRLNRQPK